MIPNVDSFFKFMETTKLEPGFHVINNKVDLIVLESETAQEARNVFENHQNCIDIHFVLFGSEKISVGEISPLKIHDVYNKDTDCELYKDITVLLELQMKPGYFIAIFPGEPHETTVSINGHPAILKKVVVKVKL